MSFRDWLDIGAENWLFFMRFLLLVAIFLLALLFIIPNGKIREKSTKSLALASAIYLLVLLFVYLYFVIGTFIENFHKTGLQSDTGSWGQVGDYFGGMLNPVLTFASFIALLYTIRIQSAQINESKAAQELATFESAFFPLIEALRSTPRPNRERIGSLTYHHASYNGDDGPKTLSEDYRRYFSANEQSILGFSVMFYECVLFLNDHKSAKPVHWTILASVLGPLECYYVTSLCASEDINPLSIERFSKLASDHRLFRRAKLVSDKFVSIGHGDSRVDGAWSQLHPEKFGLERKAFTTSDS